MQVRINSNNKNKKMNEFFFINSIKGVFPVQLIQYWSTMEVYVVNQVFVKIIHVFNKNQNKHVIHKKHVQEKGYGGIKGKTTRFRFAYLGLYYNGFMLL